MTSTFLNWIALFTVSDVVRIVLDALRHLHVNGRLVLHGYVVMENHLHLIGTSRNLSGEMRSFKSFTARQIVDWLASNNRDRTLRQLAALKKHHKDDQDYQVWEEGFHPQVIQGSEMLRQKLDYMHNNPVRRGYVDDPAHWRLSSYRNYIGLEGALPIERIGL